MPETYILGGLLGLSARIAILETIPVGTSSVVPGSLLVAYAAFSLLRPMRRAGLDGLAPRDAGRRG